MYAIDAAIQCVSTHNIQRALKHALRLLQTDELNKKYGVDYKRIHHLYMRSWWNICLMNCEHMRKRFSKKWHMQVHAAASLVIH